MRPRTGDTYTGKRNSMADLTLYHAAPSRSSTTHWMLEELGQPYDIKLISFKKGENREPDYLAINPMGKVPALAHKGVVITEVSAICAYLADEFPQAKLNIAVGSPARGVYLKWMFFAPSCVEPAIMDRAYPRKEAPPRAALGFGDYDTVVEVLAKAAAAADPYLMGKQFTAADVVIGSGLRWGTLFKLLPERPEFKAYLDTLAERPALKRATEKDARLQAEQEKGL
jgi:glutathione S-transferase